jgi:hypothetical protein
MASASSQGAVVLRLPSLISPDDDAVSRAETECRWNIVCVASNAMALFKDLVASEVGGCSIMGAIQ